MSRQWSKAAEEEGEEESTTSLNLFLSFASVANNHQTKNPDNKQPVQISKTDSSLTVKACKQVKLTCSYFIESVFGQQL